MGAEYGFGNLLSWQHISYSSLLKLEKLSSFQAENSHILLFYTPPCLAHTVSYFQQSYESY